MSYPQGPGQYGQGPPNSYGGPPMRPHGPDANMFNGQPPQGITLAAIYLNVQCSTSKPTSLDRLIGSFWCRFHLKVAQLRSNYIKVFGPHICAVYWFI